METQAIIQPKQSSYVDVALQNQINREITDVSTRIKKMILQYALLLWSSYELRKQITKIVEGFIKRLPKELPNKDEYVLGIYQSSEKWIKETYNRIVLDYLAINWGVLVNSKVIKTPPKSPIEAYKVLERLKVSNEEIGISNRAFPNIKKYNEQVNEITRQLARKESGVSVDGKRVMNLHAKSEIDLRHNHQVSELNEILESAGIDSTDYTTNGSNQAISKTTDDILDPKTLVWFSSHTNCSKRCEKYQGKLASLILPPIDDTMKTGYRINGRNVYSFKGIINQIDKYGYKNNIIVGFNCRHRLIKYTDSKQPPIKVDEKDVIRERRIEQKQRAMEREIRRLRIQAVLWRSVDDKKTRILNERANQLYSRYVAYSQSHGVPYYPERCKASI